MNKSAVGQVFLFALMITKASAFQPNAKGWHVESEVAPSISYASFQTGAFSLTSNYHYNENSGEFSLLGLGFKQSVGYKKWINADLGATFAHSVGAEGSAGYSTIGARLYTWDLSSLFYTSIAIERTQTVFLEPALGFSALVANMRNMFDNLNYDNMKRWARLTYYGPSIGLYMRFLPAPKISIRVGGSYMATRLSYKEYDQEGNLFPGAQGSGNTGARRHGLLGLLRFDYQLRDWVNLLMSVEYQSWSNSIRDFESTYIPPNFAPYFQRTRISWGAQFKY